MNIRDDFEDYQVLELMIKSKAEGSTAIAFGPLGTLEVESETESIEKKAEGRVIKSKTRVSKLNVNITGHATVPTKRKVWGLDTSNLKEGVYAYGSDVPSVGLIVTAKVVDMEGNVKYIAFPNIENVSGLKINIESDQTEIAMNEMEFSASADENNRFYYEAYEKEISASIADAWLSNFSTDLVSDEETSTGN